MTAVSEKFAAPVVASEFLRASVARMQSAPRFVSAAEAASYASYELDGGLTTAAKLMDKHCQRRECQIVNSYK